MAISAAQKTAMNNADPNVICDTFREIGLGTLVESFESATYTLADDSVTTAKILDANVTGAKLAADIVDDSTIEISSDTLQVKDGGIDTAQLHADAVDGTKIEDDAIDSEHIAAGAIDTEHLANAQVTNAKLAAAARSRVVYSFPVDLADISGAGDVITNFKPGYEFDIVKFDVVIVKAVSTAAKAADFNLEIGTTNVTGGVVQTAGTYAKGAVIESSAITGAYTGTASDTFSIEASSVTAYSEGTALFVVTLLQKDAA